MAAQAYEEAMRSNDPSELAQYCEYLEELLGHFPEDKGFQKVLLAQIACLHFASFEVTGNLDDLRSSCLRIIQSLELQPDGETTP